MSHELTLVQLLRKDINPIRECHLAPDGPYLVKCQLFGTGNAVLAVSSFEIVKQDYALLAVLKPRFKRNERCFFRKAVLASLARLFKASGGHARG